MIDEYQDIIGDIDEVITKLEKIKADLKVQAMMFDMDIDWEVLELVPKNDYKEPFWLTKWRIKEEQKDFDTYYDIDK